MDFPQTPHWSPNSSPGLWAQMLTTDTPALAYTPMWSVLPVSFPSPCQSHHSRHNGFLLSLRHTSSFLSQDPCTCYSFYFKQPFSRTSHFCLSLTFDSSVKQSFSQFLGHLMPSLSHFLISYFTYLVLTHPGNYFIDLFS